ncbi:hypothetical protein [Actinophytocola gossypii]|uniref:Uncharacterized protein n=1 Tax=Actinophytocola gossypii TaxID=2812003 RepID=A0ABT2J954_9PSEU|nr:hypothetical protein [Actinophytocola gossypii]MCT2584397.1 hypothetical protein [Actinophytocola gossypii]
MREEYERCPQPVQVTVVAGGDGQVEAVAERLVPAEQAGPRAGEPVGQAGGEPRAGVDGEHEPDAGVAGERGEHVEEPVQGDRRPGHHQHVPLGHHGVHPE